MTSSLNACLDRTVYEKAYPGSSFEEARAIVIGQYLEKELPSAMESQLKIHFKECACCTEFLGELEKINEFKATTEPFPYAVCPSSEEMDIFVFDRTAMNESERGKIHTHLRECPLCREEADWLKTVEHGNILPFRKTPLTLLHYASMVAAVLFFVISAVLWWQQSSTRMPENQLRALAHIKDPAEINYASLQKTSPALSPEKQQIYEEGVRYFKEGNFQKASQSFESVLSAQADHSGALFLLGYCYYELNQLDRAFALCDRAEAMHPMSYERCISLVHIALKTGHYDRAVREITTLYHNLPQNEEVRQLYHQINSITHGKKLKLQES
jgi:tetratricopeptide (TPR) repeat protein